MNFPDGADPATDDDPNDVANDDVSTACALRLLASDGRDRIEPWLSMLARGERIRSLRTILRAEQRRRAREVKAAERTVDGAPSASASGCG